MDGQGPDVKRPRLSYEAPSRMPSQQHHHPGILPAPPSYAHPPHPPLQQQQQPPPPPSPYHNDAAHDSRNLPEPIPTGPSPHSYVQGHSGHSTPRDGRFQLDLNYPRRGSASATPRSPDDHHQFPPPRPTGMPTTSEGQYSSQYASDPSGHLVGYQTPDPHLNGNMHHGLPMHGYEGNHVMAHGPHPDYNQSPVSASPHPYSGMPYGSSFGQAGLRSKKGNRATQACDVCRTRKAKCDEGRPRCGFCLENDLQCNYQSVAPAKVDRHNQQILDQLKENQEDVKAIKVDFSGKLERIERLLSSHPAIAQHASALAAEELEAKPSLRQLESPSKSTSLNQNGPPSTVQPSTGNREQKIVDHSPSGSFNTTGTDTSGSDNIPSVARQNAIHVEHNTAAQKLFRWPSIKALLLKSKKLGFTESMENYVMNYELKKGPLRLYGRGQGQDLEDGNRMGAGAPSPASSSASGPGDDNSESRSPVSSPESLWGCGFNPQVGESRTESVAGGLTSDNTLKLDPKTLSNYLESYLQNIHIMHPFLDEQVVTRMVDNFKRRYNPTAEHGSSKASFAVPLANANLDMFRDPVTGISRPAKRKASDAQYHNSGTDANYGHSSSSPKPLLERSPTTAIILLVMALGKICECREALPGPVPTNARETTNHPARSHSPKGYHPHSPPDYSMRRSPSSSSHSTGNTSAPSPMGAIRHSHLSPRSSFGELPTQPRNLDVIPGLAYYAQATDILGNMMGSTNLLYVQCCLLAGLYAGQLANSFESLMWIQCAAKTLCMMITPDPSLQNVKKSARNPIKLAFHTCSQLESDILAEIDLPRSGLEKIKGVYYPDGYVNPGVEPGTRDTRYQRLMEFYSYQLHIRGILDMAQEVLYSPDQDLKVAARGPTRNVLDGFIKEWRYEQLKEGLRWEDEDSLATEILHARLRGKFYGAQYIIHRPSLHYALELDADGKLDQYMSNLRGSSETQAGAMPPPKNNYNPYLDDVLASAKTSINAARLSTTAFDGVLDHKRLIVTNIFGTAHAQFGNMLVLSAVYRSKHLKHYISKQPRVTMDHLFSRTIRMLSRLKPISPTLGHDEWILECLRKVVLEGEDQTPAQSLLSSQ